METMKKFILFLLLSVIAITSVGAFEVPIDETNTATAYGIYNEEGIIYVCSVVGNFYQSIDTGVTWSAPDVYDATVGTGSYCRIEEFDDELWIFYKDSTSRLVVTHGSYGSWAAATQVHATAFNNYFDVDQCGEYLVVSMSFSGSPSMVLAYSIDGLTWSTETVIDEAGAGNGISCVNSKPNIVKFKSSSSDVIQYTRNATLPNAGSWAPTTIETDGGQGYLEYDYPYVLYYDSGTTRLKQALYSGGAWYTSYISALDMSYPRISGTHWAAYYDTDNEMYVDNDDTGVSAYTSAPMWIGYYYDTGLGASFAAYPNATGKGYLYTDYTYPPVNECALTLWCRDAMTGNLIHDCDYNIKNLNTSITTYYTEKLNPFIATVETNSPLEITVLETTHETYNTYADYGDELICPDYSSITFYLEPLDTGAPEGFTVAYAKTYWSSTGEWPYYVLPYVYINATGEYGNSSSERTDATGAAYFFVQKNATYTFTASKTNYQSDIQVVDIGVDPVNLQFILVPTGALPTTAIPTATATMNYTGIDWEKNTAARKGVEWGIIGMIYTNGIAIAGLFVVWIFVAIIGGITDSFGGSGRKRKW